MESFVYRDPDTDFSRCSGSHIVGVMNYSGVRALYFFFSLCQVFFLFCAFIYSASCTVQPLFILYTTVLYFIHIFRAISITGTQSKNKVFDLFRT